MENCKYKPLYDLLTEIVFSYDIFCMIFTFHVILSILISLYTINPEKSLIKVYGVPTCDKIKKTKSLLDNNKISYTFFNVRNEPLDRESLSIAVEQLGLDIVLNRKGLLYKKLGLKNKDLNDQQLFDELFKEQGMIKRPLIEKNGLFHCGFDELAILEFVK